MVGRQILKTIKENRLIENGQHIVIGLSGGPDSVCLFHVLTKLAGPMNLRLYPVHVNHMFRPGDAEKDQEYTEDLCRKHGLSCRTVVADCNRIAQEQKMTSEEAGRLVRYRAFADMADEIVKNGADRKDIRIAVAQNADDQAETILFRILRGTSTEGLSGISYRRYDSCGNMIIRPLLDVFREDIEKYCEEEGLEPRTDLTNLQPVYTRNKIRLGLIPYIEENFNPSVKKALIRLGRTAEDDNEYLRKSADELYSRCLIEEKKNSVTLSGRLLRDASRPLRRRVLREGFTRLGLTEDMGFVHYEGCESVLFNEKPSAKCDMPAGYYITGIYGDVRLVSPEESDAAEFSLKIMTYDEFRKSQDGGHRYEASFDYDLLREEFGENPEKKISFHPRNSGDYIPIGEGRNKKIQDYFVDRKIPKDDREKVILAGISHEILWVSPYAGKGRFSYRYKISDGTKNVISIEKNCYT